MTRIISGQASGLTLDVPGRGTRPTSDRVRESLFGALESADAIDGARVLDLYSGSGALGLESVSRGADHADLVDHAGAALACAQRNIERVATALGRTVATAHRSTATTFLARSSRTYDLVFLDPPYDVGEATLSEVLGALVPVLAPEALVIVERASRSPEPSWPEGLERVRDKTYGDTALWWAQPREASQSR